MTWLIATGWFYLKVVGFLAIADGFIQFNCRHKKHLILPDFLQLFSSSDGIQLIFRWYNFSLFKCYTIKPFLDGKEILLHIIFFQCKFLPPIGTGCDLMAVKTFVRFLNTFKILYKYFLWLYTNTFASNILLHNVPALPVMYCLSIHLSDFI